MAGVALGSPSNVFVDPRGFLHLRITKRARTATAAELFSRDRMGFGTYQWQIEGSLASLDPATVLGLFPYGPEAAIGQDGENELDVEFSRWGGTLCAGKCDADFTVWPATGHRPLGPIENDFALRTQRGPFTTARLIWTSTRVTGIVMDGLQPVGTTARVLHRWTFAPRDYQRRIPQLPVPVGMNLWAFRKIPARSQEIVLRDFQYWPTR